MKKVLYALIVVALMTLSIGPSQVYGLEPVEIVSVNYPSVVAPGEKFCFSVTVKVNSGQLIESRGDMLRNIDDNLYGHWPHVAVSGTVNTGGTYTFNCYGDGFTAPSTEGTYESKWRVWQNGTYAGNETVIRFEVRNGGGGGGGGGGVSVQCPGGISVSTSDFQAHRSVVINFREVLEYATQLNYVFCDSEVDVNVSEDGFELNASGGSISTNDNLELNGFGYELANTEMSFVSDIAKDNTDFPGLPYYGYVMTQSSVSPINDFSIKGEYEERYFTRSFVQPNFAYLPSFKSYVVETLANARYSLSTADYAAFILTMAAFVVLGGIVLVGGLVVLRNPTPLRSSDVSARDIFAVNNQAFANQQAIALFEQRYGYTKNWADIFDVTSDRTTVSAYTEFTISGTGFSPDKEVYYQFGLPSSEPLITGVATTDSNGNVEFVITMPEPSSVALGTYLLAVFDDTTVDATMRQALNGSLDPSPFLVGVTVIEVVEDVTPPTIIVNSPLPTDYDRCDKPVVDFIVTDDLSGVASVNSWMDQTEIQNGATLDMLFWNLGAHVLDVQAFDKVGWEQNQQVEFQLVATISGTRCALNRFRALKLIKNNGAYTSISHLLISADRSLSKDKTSVAVNQLKAALKVLVAQKKHFDVSAYKILYGDIKALTKKPLR